MYRVECRKSGASYAAKQLITTRKKQREHALAEINLMKDLASPYIIRWFTLLRFGSFLQSSIFPGSSRLLRWTRALCWWPNFYREGNCLRGVLMRKSNLFKMKNWIDIFSSFKLKIWIQIENRCVDEEVTLTEEDCCHFVKQVFKHPSWLHLLHCSSVLTKWNVS